MVARGLAFVVLLVGLVAVPASAAPPADAFCVVLIEALDGHNGLQGVRVLVDEETSLEERAALFPDVDGDGDGTVTRTEGDAWRRANLRLHNGTDGLPAVQAIVLRPTDRDGDGQPLYAAVTRQVGHTFHRQAHVQPWPVTESAVLETQAVREFAYSAVEGSSRFELLGGRGAPSSATTTTSSVPTSVTTTTTSNYVTATEYVVLRAPAGWLVERVQGSQYDRAIDERFDAQIVDLPAFDTSAPFRITFVRAGYGITDSTTTTQPATPTPSGGGQDDDAFTIPAPALVPLLALAFGAWALRRRL